MPTPEKLASLGFSMPTSSFGQYPSVTYFNIERTKAVVIWPNSMEVRLAVKPFAAPFWSDLHTGTIHTEQAFNELLIIEAFILPQQVMTSFPPPEA